MTSKRYASRTRLRIEELEDRLCLSKLFATPPWYREANALYRYEVPPDAEPTLEVTLNDPSFSGPTGLAFNSHNELFVTNWVERGPGQGWVSRFLDPGDTLEPNGYVFSEEFSAPVNAVFRGEEMFVTQEGGGNVLRFLFDEHGTPIPNGAITEGLNIRARGVVVTPWDELFVTLCCGENTIRRFYFGKDGTAFPSGSIQGNGLNNPHDMVFSWWGELFVANAGGNTVSRFVFDEQGNAFANGQIVNPGLPFLDGPVGLAFSPWGELFVANQFGEGGISRWLFDESLYAVPNGLFHTQAWFHDIEFMPEGCTPAPTPRKRLRHASLDGRVIDLLSPANRLAHLSRTGAEALVAWTRDGNEHAGKVTSPIIPGFTHLPDVARMQPDGNALDGQGVMQREVHRDGLTLDFVEIGILGGHAGLLQEQSGMSFMISSILWP